MKRFGFWFAMQFISYALIVANGRAYTHGLYSWTVISDLAISVQAFTVGRKFVQDSSKLDWVSGLGYVLGGASGSVVSIAVTKWSYGV